MNFALFKDQVSKELKLSLNSYKETQLKRRIDNLVSKSSGKDYQEYLTLLRKDPNIVAEFMDYITINVSEFFRNPQMFKVLEDKILPSLLASNSRIKIWSAACSIGCEPYSIAMILSDIARNKIYQIEATDIDTNILDKARRGSYTKEELKNISPERIKKYFTEIEGKFVINQVLKSKIKFKKHDLLLEPYPSECDLIVCRNVTIYFNKESQDSIYAKFIKSLKPGGYLFIGGTENIFNSKALGLEKVATCFYQKI